MTAAQSTPWSQSGLKWESQKLGSTAADVMTEKAKETIKDAMKKLVGLKKECEDQ